MWTKQIELSPASDALAGLRILVAEDEYLQARDVEAALREFGAIVEGPCPDLHAALAIVERGEIDGAVIDLNLRDEMASELVEALRARHVPFVIASGYAGNILPIGLSGAPRLIKPFIFTELVASLVLEIDRAKH